MGECDKAEEAKAKRRGKERSMVKGATVDKSKKKEEKCPKGLGRE